MLIKKLLVFFQWRNTIIIWFFINLSPMTTQDIAKDIYALCKEEKYTEVYDKYYTEETRAIEAIAMWGKDPVTVWVEAIKAKAEEREKTANVVNLEISEPTINDNQFILKMTMTTKNEKWEERTDAEYVLYTVKNEKVVEERFFYL